MRVFICAALLIVLSFAGTEAEVARGNVWTCCWSDCQYRSVGYDCGPKPVEESGAQRIKCCRDGCKYRVVGYRCAESETSVGGSETAIAQDRAFQIKTVADGFTCRKNQQLQFEPAMTKEECAQMVLDKGSDKGCWKSESGGVVFHLNEEGVDCRCARADYDGKICPKESTSWNGGRESNSIYTIYELAYGDDCTVRGSTIAGSSSWWSCNYDNMASCSSSCCCNPGYVANGDECGKCTAPVFVLENEVTAVRRYVDCDGDDAECDETELNLGLQMSQHSHPMRRKHFRGSPSSITEDNAHLRKVNKALLKAVQTMNS